MLIHFTDRPSDSPFVERIWRSHSERAGAFQSIATCHWDMVVSRLRDRTTLTLHVPETRATLAELPPDGQWFEPRLVRLILMREW